MRGLDPPEGGVDTVDRDGQQNPCSQIFVGFVQNFPSVLHVSLEKNFEAEQR